MTSQATSRDGSEPSGRAEPADSEPSGRAEPAGSEPPGSSESPFFDRPPIEPWRAVTLLSHGEVRLVGRMPYSSNATFLVDIHDEGLRAQAVYKPVRGERPLWDFPPGLCHREAGAFEVDRALGWGVVPPTVVRSDLPLDEGSLQLFMPAEFSEHYFTLVSDPRRRPALQRICALDFVINNTDRKSGHCLLGTDGDVWAIDNGLSFHCDFKLRTVIWDFAGEELPPELRHDLRGFTRAGLPPSLTQTLTERERSAVMARADALASAGRFPVDDTGRRWPWPLV